MKLAAIALALSITAPTGEAVAETKSSSPLQLKPKAAIAGVTGHRYAPFYSASGEPPALEILPKSDDRHEASGYSCSGERSLCYDPTTRRVVFKPARALMPDFPGLQRENISVRRDRIVFRYSF